nr:MAG TPA: hypothetical protein [Caudoviricetes sp.]
MWVFCGSSTLARQSSGVGLLIYSNRLESQLF